MRNYLIWKLAYLALAGGVFMIDQTTKAWATRVLRFGGDMPVISGFLNFAYAQNTGVAFSMLDEQGDAGRWGLSAVALVAGTLVLYFFWRTPRTDDRVMGALALLLAGIAGNVTDRLRLGFVVDFIDVQFGWRPGRSHVFKCCQYLSEVLGPKGGTGSVIHIATSFYDL